MEGISTLLLLALIIIVVVQNNNLRNYLSKLEGEIKLLQKQLSKIILDNVSKPFPPIEEPVIKAPVISTDEQKPYKSIFSVEERKDIESNFQVSSTIEPISVVEKETILQKNTDKEEDKVLEEPIPNDAAPPVREKLIQPTLAPTFFERHPDMEKFIGENLINKIGIAILVLAIGFFVKYAIDQNWVGAIGRVAIGIICGGILIGIAHKLRNSYKSFSSVLAGGGLAVFYFTITLAYKQFGLFGQTTAFVIMLIITVFAVILSILYDKQELAIIALVGGFIAPFLVSTGTGNYITLFVYLIVLNSGLLVIAYYKSWRLLNLLSFIFTIILFGSWLLFLPYDASKKAKYANGFLFAVIFYLLFFAINIAYNVSEKKKFIASDFGILLANTALFFGAGIYCLSNMGAMEYKGLFSASMGVFNLAASYFLFRKQKMDSNILYLLIGITLTFISITAPLQLHGNYITLFWASEAVLLYWLYFKSKISIIQYSSLLVWVLMLISLLLDWINVYIDNDATQLNIILNKGFITTVFAAMSTYLMFVLTNNALVNNEKKVLVSNKNVFRIAAIVLLFFAGYLEINYQFTYYYPNTNMAILYLILYLQVFIITLILISEKVQKVKLPQGLIAILLSGLVVIYLVTELQVFNLQSEMLTENKNGFHFVVHWLSVILISFVIYKITQLIRGNGKNLKEIAGLFVWPLCAAIVTIVSIDVHLILRSFFYSNYNSLYEIERVYIKTGLPILWGICSFAFMWLGMHYKFRTLRIISLSLFSLTLFKLFVFDIRNIPAGGKIAAFFCLGILLLVVSFMYQRLKKIIIDDEKKIV